MAHGICPGVTVSTDDRPLSLELCNREGTVIAPYTSGGHPEWVVQWNDDMSCTIIHEKFLVDPSTPMDRSIPSNDELLVIAARQLVRARLSESEDAATLARLALETVVERIKDGRF